MVELQKNIHALVHISAYITLIIFILAVIEGIVFRLILHRDYDVVGALCSFFLKAVRVMSESIPLIVTVPVGFWLSRHPIFDATNLGIFSYVILFIGYEFGFYVRHRFGHQTRWLWIGHQVHHSPNELNLAVALRVSVAEILMGALIFHVVPLSLLGFDPITILGTAAIGGALALWNHSTWIPKLGPLEGILSTPSAHRVHHARNPEYLGAASGANFGALTVIFDRLFGTYKPERDDIVIEYGLVDRIYSNNPFTISFHLFVQAYKDLEKASNPIDVIRYFIEEPGAPWPPVRAKVIGQQYGNEKYGDKSEVR